MGFAGSYHGSGTGTVPVAIKILIAGGFGAGAARLVEAMQGQGASSDDCALVLIWRS